MVAIPPKTNPFKLDLIILLNILTADTRYPGQSKPKAESEVIKVSGGEKKCFPAL